MVRAMGTVAKAEIGQPDGLVLASVSRRPQQGRSKASFERMLAAAEKLMLEHGDEDFTLKDVSRVGKVSIGSIYLRFQSKENLVRSVIASGLRRIEEEEDRMIARVSGNSPDLATFIPNYVDAFAEFLLRNAPLLRLSMARAAHDPLVSGPGKHSAYRSAEVATTQMLHYAAEFAAGDHARKVNAAYQIIFATLARHLSLGSTGESAHPADWTELKTELARMCLAYLRHAD
jgi:AcrR family transcriptional regulator